MFLKGALPRNIIRERARLMREVCSQVAEQFRQELVGTFQEVLVEKSTAGELSGTTGNFIPARFPGPVDGVGKILPVRITGVLHDGLHGLNAKISSGTLDKMTHDVPSLVVEEEMHY